MKFGRRINYSNMPRTPGGVGARGREPSAASALIPLTGHWAVRGLAKSVHCHRLIVFESDIKPHSANMVMTSLFRECYSLLLGRNELEKENTVQTSKLLSSIYMHQLVSHFLCSELRNEVAQVVRSVSGWQQRLCMAIGKSAREK